MKTKKDMKTLMMNNIESHANKIKSPFVLLLAKRIK
jgi:hypothetical protein